ncbi:hypothetical protein KGF54_003143 [Candida jiufengensis]|uniref:uncharacterized protein n=1 Tax=Candida jiufengensis TaxID=497108 RepID=UPI002225B361|nr:uncharacterized protein KGF54_003143 [Candida jiufengensis]KAI5952277.1 hypothetical protein KGF54_003143 [Candida jiufengensis]
MFTKSFTFITSLIITHFTIWSNPIDSSIRPLKWNDINFLSTTDTHGWYSGHINQKQYNANWGDFVSFVINMRQLADSQNQDLLLIDSGDKIDGSGISDATKIHGLKSTPIFVKQSYDILTIGNHELYLWESSKQEYEAVEKYFPHNYISSNVEFKLDNGTFVPFGSKYRYFTTKNQKKKVLAFGFLFDFKRFNEGTKVTPIKEEVEKKWFKNVLKKYEGKVDLIVIAGHTPIAHGWPEFYHLHSHLREYYPDTIIQYFGGHSHIRDFAVFDNKSTGIQSGRYCETVGWVSIDLDEKQLETKDRFSRSYIDFNLDSFHTHSKKVKSFDTEKGLAVTKLVAKTRKELKLNTQIGTVNTNYYVDYVPIDHPKNIFNLITTNVLNDLPGSGERIILINTGSIRYDLYKGPYTIDSQYIVSPFENKWVNLTIPKSVASKVAEKLNDASYITTIRLKPPHHYLKKEIVSSELIATEVTKKLSKGYVTHDDFGSDGDDTPHRAVINFDIPNVVQSVQFENEEESYVDLVFYDFITPNIKWALNELNYEIKDDVKPTEYSNIYLGCGIIGDPFIIIAESRFNCDPNCVAYVSTFVNDELAELYCASNDVKKFFRNGSIGCAFGKLLEHIIDDDEML